MNKLLAINYIFIIFVPIILYVLIIISSNYKKKSNLYSVSTLQENFLLTMYYLDQFYVSCRIYTFIISAVYLFSIILIFVLIRYIALGQTIILLPISSPTAYTFFYIVFVYAILFISLVLYKTVLDMLFRKEINKSYLYMLQFTWFRKFLDIIDFKLGEYIIGCIRIPCYQIATLTYKENRYTLNQEHIHHLQNEYLPEKEYIIQFLLKVQNITERHLVLQKFFAFLASLLRIFHIHINGISQQLPYVVLAMIFLVELYNKQLHYIFTALFIFFLIRIKRDLNSYRNQRASHYDLKLCDYFYRNKIPYAKQRLLLFPNNKLTKDLSPIITPENQALFYWYKKIVHYTMNNFKWHLHTFDNKIEGIYKRFFTLVCFCYIMYYLSKNNTHYNIEGVILDNKPFIYLLILLLLIMGYTGYKTYYPINYEEDPWVAGDWKYSRTHNMIFWIATIIQGYIFWLLVLKPELIISDTEVLLDSVIKITRIYTIDEKIIYLYQYFEYSVGKVHYKMVINNTEKLFGLIEIEQEFLRYHLRQGYYINIINETTSLSDIHEYICELYQNYFQFRSDIENFTKDSFENKR